MTTIRVALSPLRSVLLIALALVSGAAAFSVTRPYNHGATRPSVGAGRSAGVGLQKTLQFMSTESEEPEPLENSPMEEEEEEAAKEDEEEEEAAKEDEEEEGAAKEDEEELMDARVESLSVEETETKVEASAALEWARQQLQEYSKPKKKKKYVIVGAGWGGWGAAKALCESGVDADITIIDALPDPTGNKPYLSKTGKPVEAGTRGFWKDYPNINKLCAELGLDENKVFTDFTNSSFYSPDGLEATAPVFSKSQLPDLSSIPFLSAFSGQTIPQLPSPLGQVIATFPLFERIPLADRASMVGLLVATIDCLGADEDVQEKYDRMTAHDLFVLFGISDRMVEDFIKPTLLVGLFKPPEELSALVVMELLYYYALAHQDSFDVRWIRNGTVSDSLVAPLANKLQKDYNLNVLGGCRVGCISLDEISGGGGRGNDSDDAMKQYKAASVTYQSAGGVVETIDNVDGVILALTCRGMQSVVAASPDLARFPTFSKAASLTGIDVISTRIWLDRTVETRTPANVFARFEELRGAGGTFFMLDQLQADAQQELWGKDEVEGSVVACDFYNAGALMTLPDEELVRILMEELLPAAVPAFSDAVVVDSWVGKYAGAVSWFSPGSYTKRPPLQGAGRETLANLKCAGDWVRMGDREHGAKGLCQERAFVSGLEAANALLADTVVEAYEKHAVLAVRPDEAQFELGVAINRQVMKLLPRFWVR
jgi:uncharacterized protein with NAD-binding domain and iron-sulfur cluster